MYADITYGECSFARNGVTDDDFDHHLWGIQIGETDRGGSIVLVDEPEQTDEDKRLGITRQFVAVLSADWEAVDR